jgi:hypothetical protein
MHPPPAAADTDGFPNQALVTIVSEAADRHHDTRDVWHNSMHLDAYR